MWLRTGHAEETHSFDAAALEGRQQSCARFPGARAARAGLSQGKGSRGRGCWGQYQEGVFISPSPFVNPPLSLIASMLPPSFLAFSRQCRDSEKALGKRVAAREGRMWKGLFYFADFVFAFHSASGLFGESEKYLRSVCGAFSRSAEQGLTGLVSAEVRACARAWARRWRAGVHVEPVACVHARIVSAPNKAPTWLLGPSTFAFLGGLECLALSKACWGRGSGTSPRQEVRFSACNKADACPRTVLSTLLEFNHAINNNPRKQVLLLLSSMSG